MKNLHILTTSIAAIAASTQSISAETLMVPEQYPDIQSAIDASTFGDTIDVGPGNYGSFEFGNNQQITVLSIVARAGSQSTFLSSNETIESPIIRNFDAVEGTQVHISGFSIENVDYVGDRPMLELGYVGGLVNISDFKILNCNSDSEIIEGGAWSNLQISNCHSDILMTRASMCSNSVFTSCTGTRRLITDCDIYECQFSNCQFEDLVLYPQTVKGCTFEGNSTRSCIRTTSSNFFIEDCTFRQNQGMQVYVDHSSSSQGQVINCLFENNSAANFGTGIFSRWSGQIYISGCEFFGNTSNVSSGAIHQDSGEVVLIGTDVCGNLPNNIGGSVEFDDPSNNISVNCEEEVSCCLPGSCLVLPTSTCADAGGISLTGDCNQEDCPNEGACCIDGDCVFTTLETCFDLGGNYAGFGTDCASTICESNCEGDISGNGDVGLTDLIAVLSNWGPCPG